MSEKISSILNELDRLLPARDKHTIVEARANHVIVSFINLTKLLRENFPEEDAEKLIRRLFLAVKTESPNKFRNSIRQLREKS